MLNASVVKPRMETRHSHKRETFGHFSPVWTGGLCVLQLLLWNAAMDGLLAGQRWVLAQHGCAVLGFEYILKLVFMLTWMSLS